jgi:hypothetical protein
MSSVCVSMCLRVCFRISQCEPVNTCSQNLFANVMPSDATHITIVYISTVSNSNSNMAKLRIWIYGKLIGKQLLFEFLFMTSLVLNRKSRKCRNWGGFPVAIVVKHFNLKIFLQKLNMKYCKPYKCVRKVGRAWPHLPLAMLEYVLRYNRKTI